MRHDGACFDSYVTQATIDSLVVIACIDNFCKKLSRPTTLVIDNAPVHGSLAFQAMIPKWEAQNLFLWFLPPYCPELNLIELLWKQIKYRWMPIDAYASFEKLESCLDYILKNLGSKFNIGFNGSR